MCVNNYNLSQVEGKTYYYLKQVLIRHKQTFFSNSHWNSSELETYKGLQIIQKYTESPDRTLKQHKYSFEQYIMGFIT